jgi:hypothetical protein
MAAGFTDFLRWSMGWLSAGAQVVPDTPGLEWTLPVNRLHWTLAEAHPHWTLPVNRLHFTIPEED